MGYGYLGAYMAFGQNLHEEEIKGISTLVNEEHSISACLYQDEDFPHIFVKRYGCDSYDNFFILWKTCWRGGGFWPAETMSHEPPVALCPIPSAQVLVNLENTFDASEWQRFGEKYNLTMKPPGWQTLICFGQAIY